MTETPRSTPFSSGSQPAGAGSGSTMPATPGQGIIGRYQILEKIGEGGMGALYLARDPAIDRLVAIKLLRRGFDTEAVRERFAREARAAGRLRHPNIVTIFDVGEHDGDPFIAMEFLAGETLAELIRHNAGLSLSRRLKLLEELCDGLAYAHRAGLVHRDIKPANLMVDAEGVLKILDFGIVRVSDSGMTQAGVLVGTINYMSPEQVLGTGVDHRSDIFAVGLVAYELLSGRQAFPGTMRDGLLRRIPNAEIEPLASLMPNLDAEVVGIVERALKKEPAERYQELARMRNDLARVRQRIAAEEERAAAEAVSASDETALIADALTEPGVSPVPAAPMTGPAADAERALAEGNYRAALSLAARLAALNPHDRNPGTIVARAEQALLERGRTIETSRPITPAGAASAAPLPSNAPPLSGTPLPPSTGVGVQQVNYLAIGVAVVALAVAGFAVYSQVDRSGPQSTVAENEADGAGPAQGAGADTPASPTGSGAAVGNPSPRPEEPVEGERAAGQAQTTPPATVERDAAADARARDGVPRGSSREPAGRPEAARGGTRRSDPPAKTASRREERELPRSEEQREVQPPVQAAPPAIPELKPANPSSALPLPGGSRPSAPAPPPPAPKPPEPEAASRPSAPAVDPRVEARAAVEALLQRYEAAREARDFAALQRVWDIPAPERDSVRRSMAEMREYQMNFASKDITIAEDARRATAVCSLEIRFRTGVGAAQRTTVTQTFAFEKRGENWIIVGLQGSR